ncbi:MAG TPA: hypothetical protein VK506_12670, partial [Conexibacter sp.]|nr:hypothetical protein [Conexibacter sp.]
MGPASRRQFALLCDDQSGFGLIEVIVSSLLLVLVATGLYLGLDAASATSGTNKHRSLASGIAQQDQDRMRAMAVTELSNYRDRTSSTVGPVTYTVTSSASWVTDTTGAASCTSGQARAHYLRIASSVTWPGMHIKPVTIESVVAPPAGSFGTNLGSLAVQVRDRNGAGVPGVSVSLTGAQSYTDITNELGCVLWGYLPVGNYDVVLARQGYVDPSAVAQPRRQAGVVGEATSTVAFDFDLGGRIQADYETLARGLPVAANATDFTAVTAHLPVPLPSFGDGLPHASYTSGLVYPFTDPYGVYAGRCAGANPVAYGERAQLALVQPGGTTQVPARLPPVDLQVIHDGTPVSGATARLTATGSGCSGTTTRTTGADGYVTDRALPYGTYDV